MGGTPGIQWVKARDGAKHAAMHRTAPTRKNYLAPNSSSAEGEKPNSSPIRCKEMHTQKYAVIFSGIMGLGSSSETKILKL